MEIGLVIRCRLCLMPDTRPDTEFVDGVCSACIAYDKRKDIDWDARKDELLRILSDAPNRDYTCIVPSSGGKDSHWQVLTLLELGARPLVVTATTCHLTPIGRRNLDNLSRYADTIEITPNREVRARINKLSLELVGDISWAEHVLIHTVPFTMAAQMDIPLVFYGENPLCEYGGPLELQSHNRMTRRWVSEFGGFLGMRPADFVAMEGITEQDMAPYIYNPGLVLPELAFEVYFLGQFLPWDSRQNAAKAMQHGFEPMLPCQANWWRFGENLDNAQTGIHDYFMWLKYGYGRACAQLSVDIRSGIITRENALKELECRDGLFPESYCGVPMSSILDRIGLTRAELNKIMADYDTRRQNNSPIT